MKTETQQQLDKFILANYQHLTLSQLADELDTSISNVRNRCIKHGITPIKTSEQIKLFILSHLHFSKKQLASSLDIDIKWLDKCLVKFALLDAYNNAPKKEIIIDSLNTRITKTIVPESNKTVRDLQRTERLTLAEKLKNWENRKLMPRHKGVYNQTGSDYLDKKNGIKTTKREMPSAYHARFK